MKTIDKLNAIIKNKKINSIVTIVYLIFILIVAYVDLNYPKHISMKFAIPVFIIIGVLFVYYGVLFVWIRILTAKEKRNV